MPLKINRGIVVKIGIADLTHESKVSGVILAAGGSVRMGQPKILLDWKGKPLIWHAVQKAAQAGLDPIIVVLGAVVEPAVDAIDEFCVKTIENPEWKNGQSTSLKAGIMALPVDVKAAIIMLADQPFIPVELLEHEKDLFLNHQASLVAPRVDKRPSTPVLFARDYFEELVTNITGDQGGRILLSKYPVTWLEDYPDNVFKDIDTLSDYQNLRTDLE
jgi:molybdenum cofactor cytidylyltransferase